MKTSPPDTTWDANISQESVGIWRCASFASAVMAEVLLPRSASSRMKCFKSEAIGVRSWFRRWVLRFSHTPLVPSGRAPSTPSPTSNVFNLNACKLPIRRPCLAEEQPTSGCFASIPSRPLCLRIGDSMPRVLSDSNNLNLARQCAELQSGPLERCVGTRQRECSFHPCHRLTDRQVFHHARL